MTTVVTEIRNPFWDGVAPILTLPSLPKSVDLWQDFTAISLRVDAEMQQWSARKSFCATYAWAIPDPESVAFVARWLGRRAIEIGAGTGYWAYLLAQSGVDMLCFDMAPPDKLLNSYFGVYDPVRHQLHRETVKSWYPVHQGGPETLTGRADRSLFLCWPPYAEPMAAQCLQRYQGDRLVFIGEGEGGCTADDNFFEALEKQWEGIDGHRGIQWTGIHDEITVYQRK